MSEDVRVVTFANRGNGPLYFKSLARIEVDPMFLGEKLADRAIRMLDGISDQHCMTPDYIVDDILAKSV